VQDLAIKRDAIEMNFRQLDIPPDKEVAYLSCCSFFVFELFLFVPNSQRSFNLGAPTSAQNFENIVY
jgi:hypothetical protein